MMPLLSQCVSRWAAKTPDAIAVVMNDERLTYAHLDQITSRLARMLREQGCKKGDRVCFAIPKSPAAIMAILGILKADCIYVPIDTTSPSSRVKKILQACETQWLLASGPVVPLLGELFAEDWIRHTLHLGWMGADPIAAKNIAPRFVLSDLTHMPDRAPDTQNTADDLAYILFTSGSTGTPKGVPITHANVGHFVEWAVKYFGVTSTDRCSGHHPLHFDLSVFDIFVTFAAGAQLHPIPPELNLLAPKLADFIRRSELTHLFSVPSALNLLAKFDAVRQNDFPVLKRLLWCGEVLPTPTLIYLMTRLPAVTFTNLYGPTEATIASSYYTVPACPTDPRAAIPIGTPCDGEELLVLDDALRPVPTGETGNLYLRGVGLSPGYWRDAEKTKAAFLPNPSAAIPNDRLYKTGDLARVGPDGLVYFLGRADTQIKSRGYRIELGEIETALNALPMLRESAVVAVQSDGFEGAMICCAYVPAEGVTVMPPHLRKELSRTLPSYMLPARWMAYDKLPKNANGKIDRPKLREEFVRQDQAAGASR
jgi:amino acid adenylation domain-containing protein